MKVPMNIGNDKATFEIDGDKFILTLKMENKKQLRLEIDNIREAMEKVQLLTGRAAWELKCVLDELLRRVMEEAAATGVSVVPIAAANIDALLQRIFPEAIAKPQE